jgi:hypothetical protein
MKERTDNRPAPQAAEGGVNVRWDDSNMRSLYANVCNVTGTREELVLLFGVHQAWRSGVKEVTVQLEDRIILSPFAAKRLNLLLTRVLREYESRYGPLNIEGTTVPGESLPTPEGHT